MLVGIDKRKACLVHCEVQKSKGYSLLQLAVGNVSIVVPYSCLRWVHWMVTLTARLWCAWSSLLYTRNTNQAVHQPDVSLLPLFWKMALPPTRWYFVGLANRISSEAPSPSSNTVIPKKLSHVCASSSSMLFLLTSEASIGTGEEFEAYFRAQSVGYVTLISQWRLALVTTVPLIFLQLGIALGDR